MNFYPRFPGGCGRAKSGVQPQELNGTGTCQNSARSLEARPVGVAFVWTNRRFLFAFDLTVSITSNAVNLPGLAEWVPDTESAETAEDWK